MCISRVFDNCFFFSSFVMLCSDLQLGFVVIFEYQNEEKQTKSRCERQLYPIYLARNLYAYIALWLDDLRKPIENASGWVESNPCVCSIPVACSYLPEKEGTQLDAELELIHDFFDGLTAYSLCLTPSNSSFSAYVMHGRH